MERCLVVHQFFPELSGIELKDFPVAIRNARHKVARDEDFVRSIYDSFLGTDTSVNRLSAARIDANWAHFRWVQCQTLAALRIFMRYQGQMPPGAAQQFWTTTEHSMHDVYYVILGTLAGAIATMDRAIKEDFALASPNAFVFEAS
jgi:hypothetical protein